MFVLEEVVHEPQPLDGHYSTPDLARVAGMSYQGLYAKLRRLGIEPAFNVGGTYFYEQGVVDTLNNAPRKPDMRSTVNTERNERMAALFREGRTLEEIGDAHGLTRERVRQVIKRLGVTGKDGGIRIQSVKRREIKYQSGIPIREAACQRTFHCALSDKTALVEKYGSVKFRSLRDKFKRYKANAKKLGMPFRLSLPEFAEIMADHLDEIGQGVGMLSPIDKSVGYAFGNVEIITAQVNGRRKTFRTRKGRYTPIAVADWMTIAERTIADLYNQRLTSTAIAKQIRTTPGYVNSQLSNLRRKVELRGPAC